MFMFLKREAHKESMMKLLEESPDTRQHIMKSCKSTFENLPGIEKAHFQLNYHSFGDHDVGGITKSGLFLLIKAEGLRSEIAEHISDVWFDVCDHGVKGFLNFDEFLLLNFILEEVYTCRRLGDDLLIFNFLTRRLLEKCPCSLKSKEKSISRRMSKYQTSSAWRGKPVSLEDWTRNHQLEHEDIDYVIPLAAFRLVTEPLFPKGLLSSIDMDSLLRHLKLRTLADECVNRISLARFCRFMLYGHIGHFAGEDRSSPSTSDTSLTQASSSTGLRGVATLRKQAAASKATVGHRVEETPWHVYIRGDTQDLLGTGLEELN
eukprot:Filipodium_phascolosomae@DN3675_c0_g1_i1.p1